MQIKDYVNEILNAIGESPYSESREISFQDRGPNAAYISGVIKFIDDSKLHFKEFILLKSIGFEVLKYGYNYLAKDDSLIFRYDNALDPKTKSLTTYPEHKHTLKELLPYRKPALADILREISTYIEQNGER